MEQLGSLKRRIGSVRDLQSVVRTMKSLAAVNIHHFEQAARAVGAYNRTLERGFQVLLRSIPGGHIHAEADGEQGPWGVVVVGSHHGMCGQFNQQVASHALGRLQEMGVPREGRRLLALGERVRARLEEGGQEVGWTLGMAGSLTEVGTVLAELLLAIQRWREGQDMKRVLLVHNAPVSRAAHAPRLTRLLPLDPAWLRELRERPWPSRRLPAYSLDRRALLSVLTRQSLFAGLYRALVESLAAENASRLAAMQAAEQNIEERLAELGGEYNRRRQAAITMELLDIVAGFEAIESG